MAKIGFIVSSLFACGGEERVVALIANELSSYHDITIYTYENRRAEGGRRNDYYLSDRIRVEEVTGVKETFIRHGIKLLYHFTGMTSGRISQYLLRQTFYPEEHLNEWTERINREKFDLMIAVSGAQTILLGYIKDKIKAKCISWEHSSFEGYFDRKTGYYRNRMEVYRKCAAQMERIVVLNQDIADKYAARLGLHAMVIPNPKSFSSKEKADASAKCFVTCGRVEREKGYDDLIEAFTQFYDKNRDWRLLIIGGGSMEAKLREMAAGKNLKDQIEITGYIHEVKENLLKGSIFMMTSRWEGFPMTVTEALEMGLPVIAYDIPAMQPLVTDGIEGKIVPAFRRDKLVEAMEELAADPDLRRRMAENAMAKAETLQPEEIAKRWTALIETVEGDKEIC
ncbi:MAG: glycosyltransferase [Lachnospiraceae bacterium]|nr:glycosyltransferase [Lachnospiraceae bacterium]